MKLTLPERAIQELIEKLNANGCDMSVNGEITSLSVKHWAESTADNKEEFLSMGEEPVFSQADLFTIYTYSVEIANRINNPPPIVITVDAIVRIQIVMPDGDSTAQAQVAKTVLESASYDFSYDDVAKDIKVVNSSIINWKRRS